MFTGGRVDLFLNIEESDAIRWIDRPSRHDIVPIEEKERMGDGAEPTDSEARPVGIKLVTTLEV